MHQRSKIIRSGSREPLIDHAGQRTFVLGAEDTDGRLEWIEATVEFGDGPPYHVDHKFDEVFHILEGEIKFKLDGELVDLGRGDTLFIPRGVPHTFTNPYRDRPAKIIGLNVPAGLEAFLRLWNELSASGTPDEGAIAELAARFGGEVCGPPLAVELGLFATPS
jgi:mannose-6-phosphate isomerase-like protein (cupin superfamily)